MAEGETRQAGSWLGDLTNEWKTAKPPEKVMIVLAIVATVGIALYLHGKSQAPNQPGASNLAGIPANFQQGGAGSTSGGAGGTNPPTTPTTPAQPKNPPTVTTTPKKGTPVSAPKPPTPIFKATPIIRQPTTLTKTYASTNHAPTVTKPPQYPHRPGGNYGITPIAPPQEPAQGNTMSQTQKRLININR